MERWPLVEVPMFIYIVLKPKVTGVNMYVNSQHLYIKRLVSPRPSFSIPAMSPVQFYFSSSKITRV